MDEQDTNLSAKYAIMPIVVRILSIIIKIKIRPLYAVLSCVNISIMEVQYLNFNKYLKNNGLSNFWLSSSEDFLCYYAQKNIVKSAKSLGVQVDYFKLTGVNLINDLKYCLSEGQLFSQKRLVIIDASTILINNKFANQFIDILGSLTISVNVCLITDKIVASQKKTKWFQGLVKNCTYVAIWPLGGNYLPWLQQQVLLYDLKFTKDALIFLQKVTSSSPRSSINLLEKLSICYSKGANIDAQDVMENCAELVDISIFTIINKAMIGESHAAINILADLSKSPKDLILIWAILNQNFLKAQNIIFRAKKETVSVGVVVKKIVRNFQEQDIFMQLLSRHNLLSIKEILFDLWCIDLSLKGVGCVEDVWLQLESLILKIAGSNK